MENIHKSLDNMLGELKISIDRERAEEFMRPREEPVSEMQRKLSNAMYSVVRQVYISYRKIIG